MQSYQFPLPGAHGSLVAFLLRLFRKAGLAPPAREDCHRTSRRHRMMLAVDQRRACTRAPGSHSPEFSPPAVAAMSKPTYFGAFCSSLVSSKNGRHEQLAWQRGERRGRAMLIATRLLSAQRQLGQEQQHRERVRNGGLDDGDATAKVRARQRQIALLRHLGQTVE